MTCTSCNGTGRIVVEIPVFADGGYSDVDQIEADCRCNPPATDDDYLRSHPWHDDRAGYPGETEYPEHAVPVVDYDRGDLFSGDYTLPAHLLA